MKYIKLLVIILFSLAITGCAELTDKKEITKSMKKSLPGIKVLNIENNEAERKNVYTFKYKDIIFELKEMIVTGNGPFSGLSHSDNYIMQVDNYFMNDIKNIYKGNVVVSNENNLLIFDIHDYSDIQIVSEYINSYLYIIKDYFPKESNDYFRPYKWIRIKQNDKLVAYDTIYYDEKFDKNEKLKEYQSEYNKKMNDTN